MNFEKGDLVISKNKKYRSIKIILNQSSFASGYYKAISLKDDNRAHLNKIGTFYLVSKFWKKV